MISAFFPEVDTDDIFLEQPHFAFFMEMRLLDQVATQPFIKFNTALAMSGVSSSTATPGA